MHFIGFTQFKVGRPKKGGEREGKEKQPEGEKVIFGFVKVFNKKFK